jgi:hypothetical protein
MCGDRLLSDMCNSFILLPSKELMLMMCLAMEGVIIIFTSPGVAPNYGPGYRQYRDNRVEGEIVGNAS